MTTLAAPSVNEGQNTLAAGFERGTDTTIVLTDGTIFPSAAHVVRIANTANTKWCLVIYTTKAANTLTMGGGAADYAVAKNVTVGDEAYEWPIGSTVELVCAADEIAQLFSEQADKIDEDGSVPLTGDWDIGNGRHIAGDKFRARDGDGLLLEDDGGFGIEVADGGIITMAKQSAVFLYQTGATTFKLQSGAVTQMLLDTENYDIQNEGDVTVVSGTDDAGTADKVSDVGVFTEADAYYIGMRIYNTTDDTYATVTAKDSNDVLAISADIMDIGEGFKLYHSRITVAAAGIYQATGTITFKDTDVVADKFIGVYIYKNTSTLMTVARFHTSAANYITAITTGSMQLGSADYVELYGYHNFGAPAEIFNTGVADCSLVLSKIA